MRHAQEHWLKLQAAEAVKLAMGADFGNEHFKTLLEETLDVGVNVANIAREYFLVQAAVNLTRAEMIHRAITRMETKDNGS